MIDWATKVATVPAMLWGVNDYEVEDPKTAADPAFNAFMAKLAPPVIRVHRGGLPAGWLAEDGKTFDVAKMKEAFAGTRVGYADAPLMLNVAAWPKWMSDPANDGIVAVEHEDAFAAYCVELMRVMRDDVKRPVAYWALTNERDGAYESAGRLDDLWRLYNKAYDAMRAFDANAKIGGPALTWPKGAWVDGFLQNCLARGKADFISYHNYGIGDVYDPNEELLARPDAFEGMARDVRRRVDAASPGRHVPIFCSEYNVKWTWEPIDRRHGNAVGAAFQASVVRRLALAGIDGAMVWHVKGNAYGILDADNHPRLTAPLYHWGLRHLVGDVATVRTSPALEVLAVTRADGGRAVLIANVTDHRVDVPALAVWFGVAPGTTTHAARVDSTGVWTLADPGATGVMQLPGYSLTLISTAPVNPE